MEAAAVEEHGSIAEAVVLSGIVVAEDDKGIVLVAGATPDAFRAPHAGKQGPPVGATLLNVLAVEGDKVQVPPLEVQAEGGRLPDFNGLSALVVEPDRPGDDITVLQHAVIELHLHPGGGILQDYHQSFVSPKGGETLQGIFSRLHPKGLEPEVRGPAAIGQLQVQSGEAKVSHTGGGVLLGEHVQGEGSVLSRLLRNGGKAPVHVSDAVGQVAVLHPGAVIGVEQDAVGVRFHLIGGVLRVQGE